MNRGSHEGRALLQQVLGEMLDVRRARSARPCSGCCRFCSSCKLARGPVSRRQGRCAVPSGDHPAGRRSLHPEPINQLFHSHWRRSTSSWSSSWSSRWLRLPSFLDRAQAHSQAAHHLQLLPTGNQPLSCSEYGLLPAKQPDEALVEA